MFELENSPAVSDALSPSIVCSSSSCPSRKTSLVASSWTVHSLFFHHFSFLHQSSPLSSSSLVSSSLTMPETRGQRPVDTSAAANAVVALPSQMQQQLSRSSSGPDAPAQFILKLYEMISGATDHIMKVRISNLTFLIMAV